MFCGIRWLLRDGYQGAPASVSVVPSLASGFSRDYVSSQGRVFDSLGFSVLGGQDVSGAVGVLAWSQDSSGRVV